MNFNTVLKEALLKSQTQQTEKGAVGFVSTAHHLLDLHFAVSSLRDEEKRAEYINSVVPLAFEEFPADFMAWLFYIRDIRDGLGERALFRDILKWATNPKNIDKTKIYSLLQFIPEYGRWDDLFYIDDEDTDLYKTVMQAMMDVLLSDYMIAVGKKEGNATLLAKWMPSINSSSKDTKERAKKFCKCVSIKQKDYRKILSAIRKHLDVVERKMCANEFDQIKYSAVPSKASLLYHDAFIRHDEERYTQYIEDVKSGKEKINASTLFPYEIVHKYTNGHFWRLNRIQESDVYEELWKALPKPEQTAGYLPVCDISASMSINIGSSCTAYDAALAMSIYLAENNPSDEFRNTIISFAENPKYIILPKDTTLLSKIKTIMDSAVGYSTIVSRVFDLVLNSAIEYNLPKDYKFPSLLFLTDMEFDPDFAYTDKVTHVPYGTNKACIKPNRLIDEQEAKFKEYGYQLPKCIWWNLNSRTGTIPQIKSENGVILMSGFSQNAVKMIESESLDPYQVLLDTIRIKRYQPIYNAFGINV